MRHGVKEGEDPAPAQGVLVDQVELSQTERRRVQDHQRLGVRQGVEISINPDQLIGAGQLARETTGRAVLRRNRQAGQQGQARTVWAVQFG